MAYGPNMLRKPNAGDQDHIDCIERQVDNSNEFADFRHGEIKVVLNSMLFAQFLSHRADIRKQAIIELYEKAGWHSVRFTEDGIVFSEVDYSMGRE